MEPHFMVIEEDTDIRTSSSDLQKMKSWARDQAKSESKTMLVYELRAAYTPKVEEELF